MPPKQYKQKTSLQSYKTQIEILSYPGLAELGFEQPSPGALLLGLTKYRVHQDNSPVADCATLS